MAPSVDQLRSACAMFALDATGGEDAMRVRLGSFLVDRLFTAPSSTSPASATSSEDEGVSLRRREKRALSVSQQAWHAFARRERELVKQSGVTDHVQVLKEVAARYKRHKRMGTPSQPALLMPPELEAAELSDGLKSALRDLPEDEVKYSLLQHGIPAGEDAEANIALLARALI